jgi:hypothetical protein
MENFEVQLTGANYRIEPQENGTFRVMEGEQKVGVVYPEPGALGVEWKTMDEMGEDFAAQIGELISEHQMGKSIYKHPPIKKVLWLSKDQVTEKK